MNAVLRLQRFAATYSRSLVAYAIVAILWIAASLLIAGFGAYAHLRYIVELAAVIGLVGIGQTVAVIGGGIDLSVSAIITVTAIILPLVTFDADATGLGAIALALLVAAGIGAVNGLGIGYLGLPPLIMTLAMATILQGLLILIAGGSAISVTNPSLDWLGSTHVLTISVSIILWAIVAAVCLFWLHGTRSGSLIFAIGANPRGQPPVRRADPPTDARDLRHLGVLRRPRRPPAPVDEWTGLCRHRRPVLAVVDRGGGARRHLDPWRARQLSWHDRRSGAARDDDGVDHGRERLGGLAQRDSRLPDFGYAAIVGPRPVALRTRAALRGLEGVRKLLVQDLDTPCAVVDLDVMENNLRRCQTYLDRHGLSLRPHIKTHKIPEFAHLQIKLGAKGVNCQKLGEAEVMVDAGIADILLTYNLIGQTKLDRLVALARRSDMKVVADSKDVIEGLSSAMSRAGLELPVLVECDTGAQRCGVTSPADAVTLAQAIDRAPGLKFKGLMTYPPKNSAAKTNAWLTEAVDLCKRSGLAVETVSNGGTPDLYSAHEVTVATEHRPGTYIYSDRTHVETHGLGALGRLRAQGSGESRVARGAGSLRHRRRIEEPVVRSARASGLRSRPRASRLGDLWLERRARTCACAARLGRAQNRRTRHCHSQPRLRGDEPVRPDLRRPAGTGRNLL